LELSIFSDKKSECSSEYSSWEYQLGTVPSYTSYCSLPSGTFHFQFRNLSSRIVALPRLDFYSQISEPVLDFVNLLLSDFLLILHLELLKWISLYKNAYENSHTRDVVNFWGISSVFCFNCWIWTVKILQIMYSWYRINDSLCRLLWMFCGKIGSLLIDMFNFFWMRRASFSAASLFSVSTCSL